MPQKIPKVSQEILAEMIGTTRTRVNVFMNRLRDLGYMSTRVAAISLCISLY